LWETHNGGSDWTQVAGSDQFDVLTITSITQSADGTWYFGTGEGIYYGYYGTGTGGFIGGGVWSSADGVTFQHLASTGITNPSGGGGGNWASVSKMASDPSNASRIYAGTNNGLMISSDAGSTWVKAAGVSGLVYDVDVASDGTVYSVSGSRLYRSPNGDPTSFVSTPASSGYPQGGIGRSECAISPTDPNYVYTIQANNNGGLLSAYMSSDAGTSFHQIAAAGNLIFDPFGNQGSYDMTMAVDPFDKAHIVVGGVSLWEWRMTNSATYAGQWTNIARQFPFFDGDPQYAHTDNHMILFHPSILGKFYIGCDGGIYCSVTNGKTYIPMNKNYRVTQFYDVASDYWNASRNVVFGGCQDNGTQFIDGLGNTAMSATAVGGGDGGQVDISFLNPNAMFETVYYGTCTRSANRGNGFGSFYTPRITAIKTPAGVGSPGFANFITPVRLWESLNDPNSQDSVAFAATPQSHSIAPGDGAKTTFKDTLRPTYNGTYEPTASVIPGSAVVTAGNVSLSDNGAGAFVGTGGSGTINYGNKTISITFTSAPTSSALVKVNYDVTYSSGSKILMVSKTNHLNFYAVCPSTLSSMGPNDTTYIKDIIQAKCAVGFAGAVGLFVTTKPLDFSRIPNWIKVAGGNSKPDAFTAGVVQYMKWSDDGNNLYFSNDRGAIFRVSNLSLLRDSVNSDIDLSSGNPNPRTPLTCTQIGSSGDVITAIDVDPSNPNNLIVSLSGYSTGNHIYTCNNATTVGNSSSMSNFAIAQGNLPKMPVYACSYDKYQPKHALVGTEFGIYSTDDVTAPSVNWTAQNATFAHVPTLQIHQSRWNTWNGCQNTGVFYVATHGRGVWKSEASFIAPTGILNHTLGHSGSSNPGILVFPSPMNETGHVTFILDEPGLVKLHIFSLKGQLMKEINIKHGASGENTIEFDSSDLASGTYMISFESGTQKGVSRFVVIK
jgi:hypothetical protein